MVMDRRRGNGMRLLLRLPSIRKAGPVEELEGIDVHCGRGEKNRNGCTHTSRRRVYRLHLGVAKGIRRIEFSSAS